MISPAEGLRFDLSVVRRFPVPRYGGRGGSAGRFKAVSAVFRLRVPALHGLYQGVHVGDECPDGYPPKRRALTEPGVEGIAHGDILDPDTRASVESNTFSICSAAGPWFRQGRYSRHTRLSGKAVAGAGDAVMIGRRSLYGRIRRFYFIVTGNSRYPFPKVQRMRYSPRKERFVSGSAPSQENRRIPSIPSPLPSRGRRSSVQIFFPPFFG